MNQYLENKWLVSLIAGILLGLSFPPMNLSFLSFPAFILFFHLADQCKSGKQLALYSYAGFLVWNLITTYWLMMASIPAGIAANLANAVLMTIPLALMRFFQMKFTSKLGIALLQSSAWISYEFLHHNWDLAWPWLTIGNAWAKHVSLIQYISFTGHLGISFWVIFTSAIGYQAIRSTEKKYTYYASISLILLPCLSLLNFNIDKPSDIAHESIAVTVIQPNHDSYQNYGGMSGTREVIDSLMSISRTSITEKTQLIVWPENSIDAALRMDSRHTYRIADSARNWNTNFLIGSGLYTIYEDDVPISYRYSVRSEKAYNIFNSTLYVNSDGKLDRYDKANLVPIVERIPFLDFLVSIDIFNIIDWSSLAFYGKGNAANMLETEEFTTPGLICYDSIYPSWIRKFVNNGAAFLTIITNDGWWGNSSGHRQHFEYARLRSIEFNRWIVRSANNGTSGIIRPDGTVQQKTKYWTRTGFNSEIPIITEQTFYAKFGDWLSYLCLGITFICWVPFLRTSRRVLSR